MPSMEVYSGKPQDKDKVVHFEDWMQTTYHGLTAELSKWPILSKDDKAKMFLGQLNKYFEKREKLLGSDESYLFPRDRPNQAALQVKPLLDYCVHCNVYVTSICWWVLCRSAGWFLKGYVQLIQ